MTDLQEQSDTRGSRRLGLASFFISLVGLALFLIFFMIVPWLVDSNLQFPFMISTALVDVVVLIMGVKVLHNRDSGAKEKFFARISLILAGIPLILLVLLMSIVMITWHSPATPGGIFG